MGSDRVRTAERPSPGPPPRAGAAAPLALNLAAVAVIMLVDWLTPAGVVVGLLACGPIVLASVSDDARYVWATGGVATLGFLAAAWLGRGPVAPAAVWVPNRVLAFLMLPACTALALLLQRRRREAERARDEALAASELNRLLMSLLAHDLRSPLAVSDQAFAYVEDALGRGRAIDRPLIADVRARLRRSLRAIDIVLGLARAHADPPPARPAAQAPAAARVRDEIEAEIASFTHEAAVRGKALVAELDGADGVRLRADALVLRQALAILLDNAIRYAVAGPVRVRAAARGGVLHVHVEDAGPGLSAHRHEGGGAGLGLKLCHALVHRAGGMLEVARDGPDGTAFVLHLPTTEG